MCALLSPFITTPPPPPPLLPASFGHDDSWQAPLIFSLTAQTVTKALVVHRKWGLVSIFRMTSHTQCISSRLCHVVPRGGAIDQPALSLSIYKPNREGGRIKISDYLTLPLYIENPGSHTWKRWRELPKTIRTSRCFQHVRRFIASAVISPENPRIKTEDLIMRLISAALDLVLLQVSVKES